jgi:hypothetical protein
MIEASGNQFIPNLAVKLLMKRLGCSVIQPNHFKAHD